MKNPFNSFRPSTFSGLIGVAEVVVTPPVGIYNRNWGAADHDIASGIHRPLLLTCISFQSNAGQEPLILISADFCVWRNADDGKKMRASILKELDIPASHLMFCLTHTHSGPVLSRENETKPGGHLVNDFINSLERKAIETAKKAIENSAPAVLTWAYGDCNLATNRDLYNEVENRYIVGFNQTEKADSTLLVGRITDEDENILGTIVNYACHPTTLAWQNSLISPDYLGAMRQLVSSLTNAPCLFLQGASGELAPAEQYTGNTDIADKHGRQLGYAVMSVLESMLQPATELAYAETVESGAPLAVWKQKKFIPSNQCLTVMEMVTYSLKPLPSLKDLEKQYEECNDRVTKERLWRQRAIRLNLGDGDSVDIPVWAWKLGNSILIGQCNETYSVFQKELRKQLNPCTVAVINLVNGSAGYLSPKELYNKNIYQVWQSPFAAGSLEHLTKTTLKIAKKLISNQPN
jgi:hypothetical protein